MRFSRAPDADMYETVRQIPSDLATKGLGDEQMRMVVM
jgi:hypothetical protein